MLAECPRCGVMFNTDQEGLVTCGICGNWFYAYEEDEDDEDEFCLTHLQSDDLAKLCEISEELDDYDVYRTIRRLIRAEWLRLTPVVGDAAIIEQGAEASDTRPAPLKPGS